MWARREPNWRRPDSKLSVKLLEQEDAVRIEWDAGPARHTPWRYELFVSRAEEGANQLVEVCKCLFGLEQWNNFARLVAQTVESLLAPAAEHGCEPSLSLLAAECAGYLAGSATRRHHVFKVSPGK